MATSSCPAFVSAPRAAVIGAASRAIVARRVAPTGAKRRVASTIVPRASADAPPRTPHYGDRRKSIIAWDSARGLSARGLSSARSGSWSARLLMRWC